MSTDKELWDDWYPYILVELNELGNVDRQKEQWQKHLEKKMYCYYSCLIEETTLLERLADIHNAVWYEGIEPFVQDFKKLHDQLSVFDDLVVRTMPQKTVQDFENLMHLVLNHPQWHELSNFAWNLHNRLIQANDEQKKQALRNVFSHAVQLSMIKWDPISDEIFDFDKERASSVTSECMGALGHLYVHYYQSNIAQSQEIAQERTRWFDTLLFFVKRCFIPLFEQHCKDDNISWLRICKERTSIEAFKTMFGDLLQEPLTTKNLDQLMQQKKPEYIQAWEFIDNVPNSQERLSKTYWWWSNNWTWLDEKT